MNRRTKEGYKLRVYLDALKQAKATTDEQWVQNWIKSNPSAQWVARSQWIAYLEKCVVHESEVFFGLEAA